MLVAVTTFQLNGAFAEEVPEVISVEETVVATDIVSETKEVVEEPTPVVEGAITVDEPVPAVEEVIKEDIEVPTGPWYVATTGSDKDDCLSIKTACATITAAIAKASAGQEVIVEAGEYPEYVNLNKAITLKGANSDIACNAERGAESVISGDTYGAVGITASNATLSGFTVSDPSNALGTGIWMDNSTEGVLIENNLVTGNQIGIFAASAGASTIRCNDIDGNNEAGAAGGAGIYAEFTKDLTIDSNVFVNHVTNNPAIFAATGADVHSNLTFSNNELNNSYGIYVVSLNGGTFSGNDIVVQEDATALALTGGVKDVTVTKNNIHDGMRGVGIRDDGYGFGENSNILIDRNAFTNNGDYGVGNEGGYTGSVIATCNWWGDGTGPSGVNNGTGDAVSANVTFQPWLTTDDLDNSPCDGPIFGGGTNGGSGGGRSGSNSGVDDEGEVLGASTSTVETPTMEQASTTANFKFMINLRFGMRGSEVVELQARLAKEGYFTFGTNTGYFGPITLAAVKAYQAAHGVPATGFVGPLTRAELNK